MRGIIVRILENDYSQEYGFINAEGSDYYFDNRYLVNGTMSDFYVDDYVVFSPGTNPYNHSQKVAQDVVLDIGSEQEQEMLPNTPPVKVVHETNYINPEQEESNSLRWFNKGRPERLKLKDFSNEEETILNKLKEVFYHTNAGHFRTREKGMEYGYSLFGPTKNYVIQLGMEKVEFAFIFCNKTDFQRRTLEETFLYLTHYVIPKVRISGHFYVLATNYADIVHQIQTPEIQGALPYSIIPFTYRELLDAQGADFDNLILTRFKEFLFERDFFSYSEPIKDRLFLFGGRDTYAKSIADRAASGEHSGIFGLRKSGKTSVINMVNQELQQREIFVRAYRCVEFARHDWFDAVYKITRDIYSDAGKILHTDSYTETNAIELFSKDIEAIIHKLGGRIVLIFDEIEQIAIDSTFDDKWADPVSFHLFWSAIVNYCEKHPGTMSLVIAGINPSISELDLLPTRNGKTSPRNPLYKKLSNENYLKPFVYEQTKRMVNELGKYMGLKFEDEVCYELQKDFGGHPFFTRQMCKLIVDNIRSKGLRKSSDTVYSISRPLYNSIKESGDYDVISRQWCKDILRELDQCYPEEYQTLLKIANQDHCTIEDIRRSTAAIPHLIGYGLVRFDPLSKEMEVSIDIVRDYLIKNSEYQKPFHEMSANEIDEEIQAGIRTCEVPLRNLIKRELRSHLTPDEAAELIRNTRSFKRDNKFTSDLESYNISQLLDPRCVTLHFYALKDIICGRDDKYGDHYEYFKNQLYPYTKAEIESFLSNLYVARTPADHHYEVHNEGTLNNFRASLKEIVKILKELDYIE